MNEEIRCAIGCCADCEHLLVRGFEQDGESMMYFKCLLLLETIESFTSVCSHRCKETPSLFLNTDIF